MAAEAIKTLFYSLPLTAARLWTGTRGEQGLGPEGA